jgi:hypothetical protein
MWSVSRNIILLRLRIWTLTESYYHSLSSSSSPPPPYHHELILQWGGGPALAVSRLDRVLLKRVAGIIMQKVRQHRIFSRYSEKVHSTVLFYVATLCNFRWHIMTSGKTHWAYYQIQHNCELLVIQLLCTVYTSTYCNY